MAPHRSGHAQLRHPAPRITDSLPAIRCCFVETSDRLGIPIVFPPSSPVIRRPLRSTGSFGSVPPLPRYYWTLRLPISRLPQLRCLRPEIPPMRLLFAPRRIGAPRCEAGVISVVASPTTSLSVEKMGPPKFLGNPHADMPRSSTPVEPSSQAVSAFRCCLPAIKRRRLPHFDHFGALSRGLPAPCLRFAAWVTPRPCKTRFRLLASFAGGDWLLPGFLCKVSDSYLLSSPLPKLRLAHFYTDRYKNPR